MIFVTNIVFRRIHSTPCTPVKEVADAPYEHF